ncbi:MAG: transglutaminase domain-containing protein [Eubacteriales bacterium]|nr:transglutaminase domain-containing protein [Eubacteriales bacterium]
MKKNNRILVLLFTLFCISSFIITELYEVRADNTDITEVCKSKGWLYFKNQTEIMEYIKNYADTTCYEDKEGIYVVIKDENVKEVSAIGNSGNGGLFSKYSDMAFRSIYETIDLSGTFGDGYQLLHVTREALETHSKGYTKEMYLQADARLLQIAESCNGDTDYEKISKAYNYLCENVAYDHSYVKGTPYSAIVEGTSVCSGYAESFQIIMEKLGVESYICAGNISGVAHAWNAVKVDGETYYVDATFGRLYGDKEKFFLFGTDSRANIYNITIADHSYNEGSISGIDDTDNISNTDNDENFEINYNVTEYPNEANPKQQEYKIILLILVVATIVTIVIVGLTVYRKKVRK